MPNWFAKRRWPSKLEIILLTREVRAQMIEQTSAFLSWALRQKRVPRIPRIRTDMGGFDPIMRKPGGRELAAAWWSKALGEHLPPDPPPPSREPLPEYPLGMPPRRSDGKPVGAARSSSDN